MNILSLVKSIVRHWHMNILSLVKLIVRHWHMNILSLAFPSADLCYGNHHS